MALFRELVLSGSPLRMQLLTVILAQPVMSIHDVATAPVAGRAGFEMVMP